jgi:hypothetical protein
VRVHVIRIWCAALTALSVASPAVAQRATGPFSGLFGGQRGDDRSDTLDLRTTISGDWEDNVIASPSPDAAIDPRFSQNSTSGTLAGNLAYDHRGDRVGVRASGYGVYRQYSTDSGRPAVPYGGMASMSVKASQKLQFDAQAGAAYSPFYQFGSQFGATAFGGSAFSDAPNTAFASSAFGQSAFAGRNTSFDAELTATGTLSPRTSLSASFTGRQSRLLDVPGSDMQDWNGHAMYSHRLSRTLGWHAGYGRGEARLDPTAPSFVNETLDVGIDYGNTLSVARRTALTFSTSTTGVRQDNATRYRLDGNVRLTRGMSRTWALFANYMRATEYLIGVRQPVLSDGIGAGLNGQLATRVKFTSQATLSRGTFGFDSTTPFMTAGGTLRLEVAANRTFGWYTEYMYYYDQFPSSEPALASIPRFSRHIVTTGLTMWIPIVDTVRPPRDPR